MGFLDVFLQPHTWAALLTLVFLEIVLGIDNIVFISIATSRLPEKQQPKGRITGLTLAMLMRIALLFGISILMTLNKPFGTFETSWISGGISVQSLIVFLGGLFLLYKSVSEIHHKLENAGKKTTSVEKVKSGFWGIIAQIVIFDMIFSFDSILTAVGMISFGEYGYGGAMAIMITAIVTAILVMMLFSGSVSNFINRYPAIQILALSFLLLIGAMLIVDAAHLANVNVLGTVVNEIPKGYIYFAIAFSLLVEFLNIKLTKKSKKKK